MIEAVPFPTARRPRILIELDSVQGITLAQVRHYHIIVICFTLSSSSSHYRHLPHIVIFLALSPSSSHHLPHISVFFVKLLLNSFRIIVIFLTLSSSFPNYLFFSYFRHPSQIIFSSCIICVFLMLTACLLICKWDS